MELAWNIFIFLLEGLGIVAVLTLTGFVIVKRVDAHMKLKSISDDWDRKRLETEKHAAHSIFVERHMIEIEKVKLQLTEGDKPKRRSRAKTQDGAIQGVVV